MSFELQLIIGVLLTSFISGVLGMGGGMILMAFFGSILSVSEAMVVHGAIQACANGYRSFLLRKDIQYSILLNYIIAALVGIFIFQWIRFLPNKNMMMISLGVLPLISFLPNVSPFLDITKRGRAALCGVCVTMAQMLSGVSGGVLDIFYINSPLNRHQNIATKGFTQALSHLFKLFYFALFFYNERSDNKISITFIFLLIFISLIRTRLGKVLLDHIDDTIFRRYSKAFLIVLGIFLIMNGARSL